MAFLYKITTWTVLFLLICATLLHAGIAGRITYVDNEKIQIEMEDNTEFFDMNQEIEVSYMAGMLEILIGTYKVLLPGDEMIIAAKNTENVPPETEMTVIVSKPASMKDIKLEDPGAMEEQPTAPRYQSGAETDEKQKSAKNAEPITGEVVGVTGTHVQIRFPAGTHVAPGDIAALSHTTSFGMNFYLGKWKIESVRDNMADAAALEMEFEPRMGANAEISKSSARGAVPVVEHDSRTENGYKKDPASSTGTKSVEACIQAGNDYVQQKKYAMALEQFEQAAGMGHADAQRVIGGWYLDGEHVEKDYEKALFWLEKSAGQNYPDGIYSLALLYLKKDYPRHDEKKALRLFQRSASFGNPRALYNVGIIYFKGMGVAKNLEESFRWFRRAAGQNLPEGLYVLGYMYESGLGTEINLEKAMVYYEKAAALGEKRALERLKKE